MQSSVGTDRAARSGWEGSYKGPWFRDARREPYLSGAKFSGANITRVVTSRYGVLTAVDAPVGRALQALGSQGSAQREPRYLSHPIRAGRRLRETQFCCREPVPS